MRAIAALCLLAASCSDPNQYGSTPAGTLLIGWDAARTKDENFVNATAGARTAAEISHVVKVKDREVRLKTRVETASLTQVYGSITELRKAPVAITSTVEDSADFKLTDEGCAALMFAGKDQFVTRCAFGAERKTKHETLGAGGDFAVCGDGRIVDVPDGVAINDLCKR